MRRGIALGHCRARDDRQRRLDRAAAAGQVFPERPPLNSWAMAALGMLRGKVDLVAIRLPSALRHAAADAVDLRLRSRVDVALGQL